MRSSGSWWNLGFKSMRFAKKKLIWRMYFCSWSKKRFEVMNDDRYYYCGIKGAARDIDVWRCPRPQQVQSPRFNRDLWNRYSSPKWTGMGKLTDQYPGLGLDAIPLGIGNCC